MDALLFACASQTLLAFARNPRWLGAEPAITMILHTWDQQLRAHRHVHCLVSGGGLAAEGKWVNAKPHFLFPVRALSRVFRGKFIEALATGLDKDELRLPAEVRRDALLAELTRQNWVVYAKPPFAGPAQVLAYLGRYTHRTAIGNQHLVAMEGDQVKFRWRDRAHADKARARAALNLPPAEAVVKESVADFARRVLGVDIQRCPVCGEGRLRLVATLPRQQGPPEHA